MPHGLRETFLLLAGAAISAGAGLSGSLPGIDPLVLMIFLFVFGLIFFALASLSQLQQVLSRLYRKYYCTIGILKDMDGTSAFGECSSWTDVSPRQWKDAIEKTVLSQPARMRVHLITRDAVFDKYAAILNPYGGVYPESDLRTQITLHKIVDYVADGGVFVSIADIPGYYAYSPQLNRRVDMTPANWPIELDFQGEGLFFPFKGFARSSLTRLFARTPLMETLGLSPRRVDCKWKVEEGASLREAVQHVSEIRVERVVGVEKNVQSVVRPHDDNGTDVTPFFTLPYRKGRFLMSLSNLSLPENQEMKQAIATAVVLLITEGRVLRGPRRRFWRKRG